VVRTLFIFVAMLTPGAQASAQQQRDYYIVGGAQDDAGRYTMTDYVDAASIVAPTPDTRRAWTWNFSAPYSPSEYAGEHGVSLREFNCATGQMRFLQSTFYTADGEVRPSISRASPWEYVTPRTMGEFELNFVCSAPETWPPIATRLYGQTPADHAAATFASR
jgi:hypothetical protein